MKRLDKLYEKVVLKEKDVWSYTKTGNTTKYVKTVGSTRYYITTKGKDVVRKRISLGNWSSD